MTVRGPLCSSCPLDGQEAQAMSNKTELRAACEAATENERAPISGSIQRQTILSADRRYRYQLWREWLPSNGIDDGSVCFIGLNPSTADETKDDATIRKCVGFAKRWGKTSICMVNLFAWRATNPKDLQRVPFPIGGDTDEYLRKVAASIPLVVAAWGQFPQYNWRVKQIQKIFGNMMCLGKCKDGSPRHPLYRAYETALEPWEGAPR